MKALPLWSAVFLLIAIPSLTWAESDAVVAVLSSELKPYQKAFEGLQEIFAEEIPKIVLKTSEINIHKGVKIIAAFGGKAATANYPPKPVLIYGMSPGTLLNPSDRSGRTVRVNMLPEPMDMLQRYKLIQPGLKRLAVVWMTDALEDYVLALESAGKNTGIDIVSSRVEDIESIPAALRVLKGEADALWLSPDPLLVNAQTFTVFNDYCWANKKPFYVSIDSFVERGATASISCDYREVGRAMGSAAKLILAGQNVPDKIFISKTVLSINTVAAEHMGMRLDAEIMETADRKVP